MVSSFLLMSLMLLLGRVFLLSLVIILFLIVISFEVLLLISDGCYLRCLVVMLGCLVLLMKLLVVLSMYQYVLFGILVDVCVFVIVMWGRFFMNCLVRVVEFDFVSVVVVLVMFIVRMFGCLIGVMLMVMLMLFFFCFFVVVVVSVLLLMVSMVVFSIVVVIWSGVDWCGDEYVCIFVFFFLGVGQQVFCEQVILL